MARLFLRLVLVIALGGLVLGACGDDESGGDDAAVAADDGGGSGDDADEGSDDGGDELGGSDDGGSEGNGGSGGEVDRCGLLTQGEIAEQFGERGEVLEGREILDQCEWLVGEDHASMDTGGVYVYVQELVPGAPPADETFQMVRETLKEPEEIDGIGDEAAYVARFTTLHARSGDLIWYVQATFANEVPDTKDRLIELAEFVAGRL